MTRTCSIGSLTLAAFFSCQALARANDPLLPCEAGLAPPPRIMSCQPQRIVVQLERPEVIVRAAPPAPLCVPPPPCCKQCCRKTCCSCSKSHTPKQWGHGAVAAGATVATPVYFTSMMAVPMLAVPGVAFAGGAAFTGNTNGSAGAAAGVAAADLPSLESRVAELERKVNSLSELSTKHSGLHTIASTDMEKLSKQVADLTTMVQALTTKVADIDKRVK
jgi:hypothetical protein